MALPAPVLKLSADSELSDSIGAVSAMVSSSGTKRLLDPADSVAKVSAVATPAPRRSESLTVSVKNTSLSPDASVDSALVLISVEPRSTKTPSSPTVESL